MSIDSVPGSIPDDTEPDVGSEPAEVADRADVGRARRRRDGHVGRQGRRR